MKYFPPAGTKVIAALIQFSWRVGIPDEIITDQGTNFNSWSSFTGRWGLQGLEQRDWWNILISPLRPCSASLFLTLERIGTNGSLFCFFAYQEVPQASTGFSPFKWANISRPIGAAACKLGGEKSNLQQLKEWWVMCGRRGTRYRNITVKPWRICREPRRTRRSKSSGQNARM